MTSIFLAALLALISTGGVNYLHELQHHHVHDAGAVSRTGIGSALHEGDDHDESACPVCATLHMPLLAGAYVPVLICLGVIVSFLTQITRPLTGRRVPLSIDCRGPPTD